MVIDYINSVTRSIEKEHFSGYDPYDALNSKFLNKLGKWPRIAATQFFRICPINLRPLFGIKPGTNSKAMGILLSSYSRLVPMGRIYEENAAEIFEWLVKNSYQNYSGDCWGTNFSWQSRGKYLKEGTPTIVNTAYVGHGLLDYYEMTKNKKALEYARSACDFILNDLKISRFKDGICFSYTPLDKDLVHNANVLGASLLSRVYSITKEEELLENALSAFSFTINRQEENGMWLYSIDKNTGNKRAQIDWHQGFILDSIIWHLDNCDENREQFLSSLKKGAEFYKKQFDEKGRSYWRYPKFWPVDIHNQAQGIITFSRLERYMPGSIDMAKKIMDWTIENMYDKNQGKFYYQKWPFFTNKIPYMRWSQAWMLYAMTTFMESVKNE